MSLGTFGGIACRGLLTYSHGLSISKGVTFNLFDIAVSTIAFNHFKKQYGTLTSLVASRIVSCLSAFGLATLLYGHMSASVAVALTVSSACAGYLLDLIQNGNYHPDFRIY